MEKIGWLVAILVSLLIAAFILIGCDSLLGGDGDDDGRDAAAEAGIQVPKLCATDSVAAFGSKHVKPKYRCVALRSRRSGPSRVAGSDRAESRAAAKAPSNGCSHSMPWTRCR